MSEVNNNANLKIYNTSKNIIALDGFKDREGKDIVLGIEGDRGIVGAPQPEATISGATFKTMMENPAIQAMVDDPKGPLNVRRPFTY